MGKYVCNCGRVFPHPIARAVHESTCLVFQEENARLSKEMNEEKKQEIIRETLQASRENEERWVDGEWIE